MELQSKSYSYQLNGIELTPFQNWGWAVERVTRIEAVSAHGEFIVCDKEQNSDLFWAARGAGPGFPAIVTAFYLEVRDRFSSVKSSTFMWPLSEYQTVMDWTVKVRLFYMPN
jgi:hypothetical protein